MTDKMKNYSKDLFENGFVHIKSLLDKKELELLISAIASNIEKPSPFARVMTSEKHGKFFMDFNSWKRLPLIDQVCRLPKLVDLVTQLTQSKKCWLFHDHVLVKDTYASPTPTHQDRPYYIVKGDLNLSVWMTPDDVPNSSGLIFYKGTHKIDKLFMPKSFVSGSNIAENYSGFERISEDTVRDFEAFDFDMKPGDALVFFNNTIHASHPHNSEVQRRALSVRYLLDGATLTKKYVNATPPFDRMGVKVEEDAPIPENFFPLLKG
jgi:ectoine hydroxylase-related dioxygenase (phytanoyl-CoA dioxygenase family)